LGGLKQWRGGSTDTSVLLVEGPGVEIRLDGLVLNQLLLKFPKYPLHLLSANMARYLGGRLPDILDLKSLSAVGVATGNSHSHRINYEGRQLEFCEVGGDASQIAQAVKGIEIICISCNYTMERKSSARLIQLIRKSNPGGLIVVGGHDSTVAPAPYLAAGADLCVLGEGETVLGEILDATSSDELRQIRGVAFLTSNGNLKRNGKRPIHDLAALLYPDPNLFRDEGMEYPDGPWPIGVGPQYMVVETSRGCDQACSFCSSTFVTGRFRSWCAKGIVSYLSQARKAGVRTLLFADDNLLYRMLPEYGGIQGRQELVDIFRWLRANGFSWTFYNGLQFGMLEHGGRIDHELIDALFASHRSETGLIGCFEAYIPLERFDEQGRENLSKLRPNEIQRQIIECIAEMKVHQLNLGFIIGEPNDSLDTLEYFEEQALEFGALISRSSARHTRVRHLPWCSIPLPGTPNRSDFKSSIRYDLDKYPELHSNYVSVIQGRGLNPIDFTLGRLRLDETLNAPSYTMADMDAA
jgi:hopanoid C-3 methylase